MMELKAGRQENVQNPEKKRDRRVLQQSLLHLYHYYYYYHYLENAVHFW